jgi:hypothetical protein
VSIKMKKATSWISNKTSLVDINLCF